MNYNKIYYSIIEKSKLRKEQIKGEYHHIVPKCMGGSDDKDNIVILTYKEHFICHWLLYKIHKSKLTAYAWHSMAMDLHGIRYNSKSFAYARKAFSKNRKGENHHFYKKELSLSHKLKISKSLTGKIQTEEHKNNRAKAIMGEKNPMFGVNRKNVKCPHCSKVGGPGVMQRWHFDNCKLKPNAERLSRRGVESSDSKR